MDFLEICANESPLQIVGTPNAYSALLAEKAGHKAIYLSGAGVANGAFGLPDLAMTHLTEVCEETRRITSASNLPLIVDADTGWGSPLSVERTFKELSKAGAKGAHIEDQNIDKRCGHRPGKKLVSKADMISRVQAACEGKAGEFAVIARTDAIAVEGIDLAIERALAYEQAGADMIFVEAVTELSQYKKFTSVLKVPVLANITEFGKTPLFTVEQLNTAGVKAILYPLTAFRAMNQAALLAYKTLKEHGTQQSILDTMQTREELYEVLGYKEFEEKLDKYLEGDKNG